MIGLMETYRVGRIPVAQLWQASYDENVLLLDANKMSNRTEDRNEGPPTSPSVVVAIS